MQFNEIKGVIPLELPGGRVVSAEFELTIGGEMMLIADGVRLDFTNYEFSQILARLMLEGQVPGLILSFQPAVPKSDPKGLIEGAGNLFPKES